MVRSPPQEAIQGQYLTIHFQNRLENEFNQVHTELSLTTPRISALKITCTQKKFMTQRQQLLYLYTGNSSPESNIVAWSFYDGVTGKPQEGCQKAGAEPPYGSVLAAMHDGWRTIQVPVLEPARPGEEFDLDYLKFQFVLEKMEPYNES
jgi:hypothetical protein